jgi:hypothetical protein
MSGLWSCRWALQGSQRLQGSKLMRSVEAYESACGFIDASSVNNWRLLHLNAPAIELLGGLTAEGDCCKLLLLLQISPA